ncbi:MAG: acylneuraminate cytidylyltransferase family protein [Nitrospira sp.]|nr:acylneuraminate cytidylyltransferase family protein [Nitrospira sp.]
MDRTILALIPARGGSKGVPRKNILPLAGKPLIAYSILQALASKWINRVVVSTDDEEIAQVAREWGAEVPFMRPAWCAEDASPDIDVFHHALTWLAEQEGYRPELVVHLRPPGPVRRVEHIDQAIELLLAHPEADAVRSVSVARQTPYKMWHVTGSGHLQPLLQLQDLPDCQSLPRQRLPIVYWQNGYVDVIRPRAILDKQSMWGTCALPYVHNEELLEVDYPEDIPAVEQALRRMQYGDERTIAQGMRHPV